MRRPKSIEIEAPERGPIRVAVVGAASASGVEAFRSLSQWERALFLLAIDQREVGKGMRTLAGGRAANVKIEDKLGAALDREPCDVMVDFSHSSAALQHGISAMKRGATPILNTALSAPEIRELHAASRESGVGALVAPHLSLGATLLLQYCNWAARWMADFEIADVHTDHRMLVPTSFAKAIAERVADGWENRERIALGGIDYATTRTWEDVPMHLMRLKGSHPRQEVHFSGPGESMTLSFACHDTSAIVPGLMLAITRAQELKGVTVGLEKLLLPGVQR